MIQLRFRLNGKDCKASVSPDQLLVEFIREQLGLTGTKTSCDIGICGACTIILDGKAVSSCSMLAFQVNGKDLLTIEGLVSDGKLHPVQDAFIECGGFQCGFCTPGMILLAKTLLDENPSPKATEIREYMDANICRCTGYQMIIESIQCAAKRMRSST